MIITNVCGSARPEMRVPAHRQQEGSVSVLVHGAGGWESSRVLGRGYSTVPKAYHVPGEVPRGRWHCFQAHGSEPSSSNLHLLLFIIKITHSLKIQEKNKQHNNYFYNIEILVYVLNHFLILPVIYLCIFKGKLYVQFFCCCCF